MSDSFFNTGLYKIFEPKYKDIVGKPFITVSAKGIVNGLSNIPNDGVDFGPDTTLNATSPNQTGPPYTQTSGIQEACNFLTQNNKTIKLLDGTFNVSTTIIFPSLNYINFIGSGKSTLIIPITNLTSVIDISNIGIQCKFSDFTVSSGINSTKNGSLSNYCIYGVNNITNLAGYQTLFRDVNFWTYETYPIYIASTINAFGGMVLDNVADNMLPIGSGYYSSVGVYINISNGNIVRIINSHFGGLVNITTDELLIVNSMFNGIKLTINEGIGNILSSNIYGSQNYNVDGARNPANVQLNGRLSLIGCYLPNNGYLVSTTEEDIFYLSNPSYGVGYISLINCFINISHPKTTNIINGNTTTPYNIYIENSILYAANQTLTCNILSSTALSNNMQINNIIYSESSSVTFNNYPSQPTTPAVPASGTAQQNTNPYAVNVYLYGGTVTEIQITKNGTAYTVFSNASGLALAGQVYKLNPSDSITITYTTAPTWDWLSD